MHTHPAFVKLHIFHHCSVKPSFNSNLLFHPIDLAIEFAGPALSLLAMHMFVWKDEGVLLYTFIIFQLWYAFDHDEHLNLFHVEHHTKCDSLYVIYSNFKDSGKDNLLKHYMVEKGLLYGKDKY
jgi:sterol desaturase/sphingolipid hydroxylase (fatty acid hydroxylase superfamily)